ncbi:MAG: hypothetical protein V4543_08685, partial [Bacteroidota bacterium]
MKIAGLHVIFLLPVLLLLSCNRNKNLKFRLPNGEEIKQTTIQEIEKVKKVHYEQYGGFVLEYQDSLFKEALLILEDDNYGVYGDVLNEDQIHKLKSHTVESIDFIYKLSDNSKLFNLQFEAQIKQQYSDYDEELKTKEGFELKKNGYLYVEVSLLSTVYPYYTVRTYP